MARIEERTSIKGIVSYRAVIRLKGFPSQSATFKRKTDAKIWAQQTEAAIRERRYFKSAEAKKHTIADMIDRYTERLKATNPQRLHDVKSYLTWWRAELGHCILADICRAMISEKLEKLSQKKHGLVKKKQKILSSATVNRYFAALSHVFTVAVSEWEWLEHHPMANIKKLKESQGRVRYLNEEERISLLSACKQSPNEVLYIVVIVAISTGMRKKEILNLQWKDVDLEQGAIILQKTKNGDRRRSPLTGHALDLMKEQKSCRDKRKVHHLGVDLVFPAPNDPTKSYYIRTAWETAVKKSGVKDFHFHDLRHTAASYLAMNQATLTELASVLGHKSLAMVKRYAHLSEAHTHSVVSRMNEKIFGGS